MKRKSYLLLLLLFVSWLPSYSQSQRSRDFYAKGVKEYQAGNYQEALTFFLTVDSLDKQEMGKAASEHIGAAENWIANCLYKIGHTEKARQINPKTYDLQPTDRREAQECDFMLFALSELISQKRYAEAVPMAKKLLIAMRQLYHGEHYNTVAATQMLAFLQYLQNQQQEATVNFNKAQSIAELLFGVNDRHFAFLMATSGKLKWEARLYAEGLNDLERSDSILVKLGELQRDEIGYYKTLRKFCESYKNNHRAFEALLDRIPIAVRRAYTKGTEDYDEAMEFGYEIPMYLHINAVLEEKDTLHAIDLANRLLHHTEDVHGRNTAKYYENLEYLSNCYGNDYNVQDSINELRLQVAEKAFKKGSDDYNDAMDDYEYNLDISIVPTALYLETPSDTLRARSIATKYMANMKRIWGKKSVHYYKALNTYSDCFDYHDMQARPAREQLYQIAVSVYGEKSDEAQNVKMQLSDMGRYGHDLEYALSHVSTKKQDMIELAGINSEYGNYQRSAQILKDMLDNLFKEDSKRNTFDNETMKRVFRHLAVSYDNMGFRDSLKYVMLPYLLSPVLSDSLSLLYALETVGGSDEEDHIQQFFDTLVTTRPAIQDMLAYPHRYAIMASAKARRNPQEAIAQIDSIEAWLQNHGGIDDLHRYFLLKRKWKVYDGVDTAKALYWYRQSEVLLRQIPDHEKLYEYFHNLATSAYYAVCSRDFDQARSLIREFHSYKKSQQIRYVYEWPTLTQPQLSEIKELSFIPDISYIELPVLIHDEKWEQARLIVKETVQTYNQTLISSLLDEISNSNTTLSDIASYIINQTCLLAAASNSLEDVGMAYDAALLGKQLYLNSQCELLQFIEQYGDQRTKDKLDLLKQARKDLDRARYPAEADSLSLRVVQLEKQVISDSQRSGDYTKGLLSSWKDIQITLRDDEVAIEFVSYVLHSDTLYAALMIEPGQGNPKIIPLPSLPALSNSLLTPTGTYHALWQPVLACVDGASTIYFSPMGILHQSPIESAIDDDGRFISERYRIYRLSSTRQLTKRNNTPNNPRSVMLYGGINYDDEPNETPSNITRFHQSFNHEEFHKLRAACNGFSYLPATLTEVESIRSIVENAQYDVTLLTGKNATERSFVRMSAHSPRIIHVATHGFYLEQDNTQELFAAFVSSTRESIEDKILSYSGLLFSGASRSLDSADTKPSDDDGIMTARELSRLDLSSTGLVALSACETGQGRVTSDGVFGLQRGFKKAGAQSILMSLWKVDDEATCLLMTEFYKNWVGEKKTKYDALETAKQAVRSHNEKGWDDPKYWAAFILLDGLD